MARLRSKDLAALVLLSACSPAVPIEPPPSESPSAAPPAAAASAARRPAASPSLAPSPEPAPAPPPEFSIAEAEETLYPEGVPKDAACPPAIDVPARIRCLLDLRYGGHEAAKKIVRSLFDASGSVAGVEREQMMDGGFRGSLHLVPELPVGRHEKHLSWIAAASADFNVFFVGLAKHTDKPVRYRHRPIAWKFFRSVKRTTPSAYAIGWTVAYNVSGSLHGSADAVRETMFHEIFHLNDAARSTGAEQWSRRALGPIHDAILARCGTRPACLTPYAPTATMVRGGTYYAFQPNNGDAVHEYAADLAARYYREVRAVLRGEKPVRPAFKCAPEENARAWKLLADEFFGGVDLVPGC
jgi:hypothetical protein